MIINELNENKESGKCGKKAATEHITGKMRLNKYCERNAIQRQSGKKEPIFVEKI